ncbi:MAG TPA: hypothetical protein GXZ30_04580 [Propionibacterium sp.]|nr:hypothetical protein [Propionibacterium sp.]
MNARLAEAVKAWIADRPHLTQPVISSNGGPSSTTLTKVLTGEGNVRPGILAQLDQGLGWGNGRAAKLLAGEAIPVEFDWTSVSDRELLSEVERRMARGGSDAGNTGKKSPGPGEPGNVTELRPELPDWAEPTAASSQREGDPPYAKDQSGDEEV